MKLVPAAVLLTFCIGWVPLSWAVPHHVVAQCLDSTTTTCVTGAPGAKVHATEHLATASVIQSSMQTPESFDAKAGNQNTEAAATASTVATLGLFGSALVILGFFRGKRSVHRQLN